MSQTIFTGLQAKSALHLGNYLGAMLPITQMQAAFKPADKLFMFVPDLHSFTLPTDHSKLYSNTLSNLKYYVAAGLKIDNPNVSVFRQSYISAHSELAWILSCFSYMGEMERMTQFKAKSQQHAQSISVGLFSYPILMAADILLYNSDYVPVGSDQQQHLELARNLAIRFNNKFKGRSDDDVFKVPKPWSEQLEFMHRQEGLRIRSLSNPEKKMSKSDFDDKGTIYLKDDPQLAVKKIMSAQTDNLASVNWDWSKQPGVTNLLQLLILLKKQDQETVLKDWVGNNKYGELKKEVAAELQEFLSNYQQKLNAVNEAKLQVILNLGEQQAEKIAKQTLLRVQRAVGLR